MSICRLSNAPCNVSAMDRWHRLPTACATTSTAGKNSEVKYDKPLNTVKLLHWKCDCWSTAVLIIVICSRPQLKCRESRFAALLRPSVVCDVQTCPSPPVIRESDSRSTSPRSPTPPPISRGRGAHEGCRPRLSVSRRQSMVCPAIAVRRPEVRPPVVIDSQKGGKKLVLAGYLCLLHKTGADGSIRWHCVHSKKCYGWQICLLEKQVQQVKDGGGVNSGHWVWPKFQIQAHQVQHSAVQCTCLYVQVEENNYSTQTLFFSLPADKRKQLYRAYMELVCYVPWKESPEESFLDEMQRSVLKDAAQDPEKDHRYSLRRLQMYWQVYMGGWDEK